MRARPEITFVFDDRPMAIPFILLSLYWNKYFSLLYLTRLF
jgi:hypothetical protein